MSSRPPSRTSTKRYESSLHRRQRRERGKRTANQALQRTAQEAAERAIVRPFRRQRPLGMHKVFIGSIALETRSTRSGHLSYDNLMGAEGQDIRYELDADQAGSIETRVSIA